LFVVEARDELAVVFDALALVFGRLLQALELKESRDLARR